MNDPSVTPLEQRFWLRRWLNRLEVDRAVFYAILGRAWQFVAGPITMLLIVHFFSPETQGYYYTFWQMIALQSFFDLSFHQVIINFASHEWEKLSLDREGSIQGDPDAISRLSSLMRSSFVWYGVAAALFFVVVGVAGLVFFSFGKSSQILTWRLPWMSLVGLTALTFWTTPCVAVLEGCNQVRSVYKLQFVRGVIGNAVVWLLIPLGASLWIPAIASLVRLISECYLVGVSYPRFFRSCVQKPTGPILNWKNEVWPFQWRVGLKGLVAYFNTFVMTPVVFLQDEAVAGQFGMTWQILTSLQSACMSWVKARAARFGMLVSKRDFAELDRIFFRLIFISGTILLLACGLFFTFDLLLYQFGSRFAGRLLPPLPTGVLCVAIVLVLIPESQWTYIHAHKRSPHLLLTIIGSLLSAVLIVGLGWKFGTTGVATAYLVMTGLFYLPLWTWVWMVCRKEWHNDRLAAEDADNKLN